MTIGFESRKDSCTHFGKGSIFEDISCMTCHDCNECNELNNKRKKEIAEIINEAVSFFVSKGKIVESGTHKELLSKYGYYYNLYCAQYRFLQKDA